MSNKKTSVFELYVPFGTNDIYKTTGEWKNFETIIEMDGDMTSIVSAADTSSVCVKTTDDTIIVSGADVSLPISVYDINGTLVATAITHGNETRLHVNIDGVYIVKVGNKAAIKIKN